MANSSKRLEINSAEKIYTFLFMLALIGNVYIIKPYNIGIGEVFIILGFFFALINEGVKIRIPVIKTGFWFFVLYSVLITLLNLAIYPNIEVSETIKRLIRDGFYWMTIFVFSRIFFNWKYAYKLLNVLCVSLSIMIILQFFGYLLFGSYIPGLLNGIPTDAGNAMAYKAKVL